MNWSTPLNGTINATNIINIIIHPSTKDITAPHIFDGICNIIVALINFCNPLDTFNNNLYNPKNNANNNINAIAW